MLAHQIRELIIKPALEVVGLWSQAAEILVYGTGMIESAYEDIVQQPKGPALGFYQMEPATYKDHCVWLRTPINKALLPRILATCFYEILPTDPKELASNIKFATLMCRIDYRRVKDELPAANDALGMAKYHKKFYNSSLGATRIEKSQPIFQKIIDGEL